MKLALILSTSMAVLSMVLASLALVQVAMMQGELAEVQAGARRVQLEEQVDELRDRLESVKAEMAVEPVAPGVRARELDPIADADPVAEASLAQGLVDLEQLSLRLDAVERRVDEQQIDPVDIGNEILRGRMPSGETVAEFLDRRMEERALGGRGLEAGQAIDKKPSLDELASVLNLDDGQRLAVRDSLDHAKDRAFELLSTPRLDGGNFVDDMAAIFLTHGEEGEEHMGALLMNVFKEPYPGTDETYGSMIFQIQGEASQSIRRTLREDQANVYSGLELDLLEVETGKNPFEAHIQRLAEERQR